MTIPCIPGFIPCEINLIVLLNLRCWLKINSLAKLNNFNMMVWGGGGGGVGGVKPFYHKMALFIGSLAPTHRSKMVWLRESFATF
jgi:hypothetical protein